MFTLIAWITTGLSIIGSILIAQKKISGFYVWIISNIFWVFINLYLGVIAQAFLFIFYIGLCIYSIIEWKKKQ
jgi:nicotinamide riboside transporter PnuC